MKKTQAKVLILYTGGTFGMDPQIGGGARIPKLSAAGLRSRMLRFVPGLDQLAKCDVEIVLNLDSSHVGPEEWIQLSERITRAWSRYDGVVVLHGTDTLAYTASALSFLLRPCIKPVIVTGAQKPLAALRSDARRNLVSAVEIASSGPRELVSQVCVFFDDRLLQGNRARKRSASEFAAFDSPKAAPLAQVGTTIRYRDSRLERRGGAARPALAPRFDSRVAMLHLTPGFPARAFDEALLERLSGLVLIAFPSGTGPTHDPHFLKFLRHARARKVPIVVTTDSVSQVPTGTGVDPRAYESGQAMLEEGVIWAGELTPECAFVKLSMALAQIKKSQDFMTLWRQDWASESL